MNAEPAHLAEVRELVRQGRYKTLSEFVRKAMEEKLARLRRERLAEQVERYCRDVDPLEDAEVVDWQSFPGEEEARATRTGKKGRGRAKR